MVEKIMKTIIWNQKQKKPVVDITLKSDQLLIKAKNHENQKRIHQSFERMENT